MTRTHEIKLDGYGAHTTLAEDRPVMLLGTAESYGIEMLHVVSGKSWEGLTVTATFNAPDGTSTDMLMDAEGSITVPSEATAKSGSGRIVFTGVSNGIQRISCDLDYFVVAHSAINGVQSGGTAPSWFEQAVTRFMPAGGTAGQVLTKLTDADFEAEWQDCKGGADGITPTIGDNGNWYLGSTDTGKPSRGEKGDTGANGPQGPKGDTGATGADGKSAYSYAQDGGYTGTETEFAAKLAAESIDKALYVVNLTRNSDRTLSADKTYDEIVQAYNEGKYSIVLKNPSGFTLPLLWVNASRVCFSTFNRFEHMQVYISTINDVTQNIWKFATTDSMLPNPYPLTFTGAVSETYDGSSAKTIEIPSGGGASEKEWTVLVDQELSAETPGSFSITGLNNFTEFYAEWDALQHGANNTTNSGMFFWINDIQVSASPSFCPVYAPSNTPVYGWTMAKYNGIRWLLAKSQGSTSKEKTQISSQMITQYYPPDITAPATKVHIGNEGTYAPVSGHFKLWGR